MAFANGYYYSKFPLEKLVASLPYLTYASVCAGRVMKDDVKLLFDDTRAVKAIRDAGKIPLLHVFCDSGEPRLSKDIVDTAILLAKARGYDGINLSMNNVSDYGTLSEFIHELKATLIEYELLLFCEIDKNSSADIADYYDGAILSYCKAQMKNPPSFDEGERKIFTGFSDEYESSKAYIEISPFAFSGDEFIPIETAMKIAHTSKCEIFHDTESKLSRFEYNKYSLGKREPKSVCFESLENVKAKLEIINELGYMGISFDVGYTPLAHLMMFDAMFRQPSSINYLS
jgi:hypothetical protein